MTPDQTPSPTVATPPDEVLDAMERAGCAATCTGCENTSTDVCGYEVDEPDRVRLQAALTALAPFGYEIRPVQPVDAAQPGASFQTRVDKWMLACFGAEISNDGVERGDRMLEEVFELLQSGGYDPARVLALRDYVWGRPTGEPSQEVGGVMVTLAAYCTAHGLGMQGAAETELARIWTKVDQIRAKPTGSALPIAILSLLPQPGSGGDHAGWRTIESAPRDGTTFDAWVPDAFGGRRMCSLSFNTRGQLRQDGLFTKAELPRWPTHWQPLPAPPSAQDAAVKQSLTTAADIPAVDHAERLAGVLGQISRMKRHINPGINMTTLNAAIEIAAQALSDYRASVPVPQGKGERG